MFEGGSSLNDAQPSFDVRPAGEDEFPLLIELFNRMFRKQKNVRTFQWKYLDNPHGKAVVWVATDPDDRIVGSLAFVPRKMRIDGREVLTLLASDGMVFEAWQRKGIFIRLLEIMCERSWDLGAPFVVAFTGRQSVPGLIRTGWSEVGTIQDLELPVQGAFLFQRVWRLAPFLRGPLRLIGNVMLAQGRLKKVLNHAYASKIRALNHFDDALADAGRDALEDVPVSMVRDKEFLNWRYVNNPTGRHTCFGAFKDGRAAGYVVVETKGDTAYIADLLARDGDVRADLLVTAVAEALGKRCLSIRSMALEGDPMSRFLKAWGFKCAPSFRLLPFMLKMGPDPGELEKRVVDAGLWTLSHGDRDAEHMTR